MRRFRFYLFMVCTAAVAQHAPQSPAADSLRRLHEGNEAYLAGRFNIEGAGAKRRIALSQSQHPFASVLACADSRVAPELVFSQGLGDLFVVRVAGAVADKSVLGSLEYAAEHLSVPLVVVVGHTGCGAVKAALDMKAEAAPSMNLAHLLSFIRPALPGAPGHGDPWRSGVYSSVARSVADLTRLSPVLDELEKEGKIMVTGAVYDLESGKVDFLSAPASSSH